jgi:FeS assembly SUF system protein
MADERKRIALPTAGGEPAPPPPPQEPPIDETADTGVTLTEGQQEEIKEKVLAVLRTCYDPELPVNIVELGLIYYLEVLPNGVVKLDMTLTAPNCPVAGSLPAEIRSKIKSVPGVVDARVRVVWDPPWTKDRMSEAAQLELGLFG